MRATSLPVLLTAAGAAFVAGVAVAHYETFPYTTLRSALASLRGTGEDADGGDPFEGWPGGLWHNAARDGDSLDMELLRDLANVPYLDGYEPAEEQKSVVLYERARAYDGLNLVVSGHAPAAALMSMDGAVVHTWQVDPNGAWTEGGFAAAADEKERFARARARTFWRRAHVFPNGDLLAIFDGAGMIKVDRDSGVLWANPGNYHHDMFLDELGTIYTLSRHARTEHDRIELDGTLEEDFVSILTPDGEETRRISILSCFLDSDYSSVLAGARHKGDMLHVNTLELMDGRFAERHPLYAAGNALISVPTLNTIAVIDLEREQVVWALGGLWKFQHQPTVLPDGKLLVFDNLGLQGASKVVEIDPLTQEITWAYRGTSERPFRSHFLGSSQRLPNGNTLITESTAGRAFEVTRDRRIIWDFVNPNRAGDEGELIASLLEVVRMERDYFADEFASAWRQ